MPTAGHSIADQTVTQLGGRTSILTRQRADHAHLHELMARARATEAAGGVAHATAVRRVRRLVFTHAFAEESVLFPAARRALPDGDPLTLHIESAHQEVNELVARLDGSSPDDPGHGALLRRTFAVLEEDVRSEEDELLPRLQQALGPRRLRLLGVQWELLRRTAPTRPHPIVSRRPPGQTLSAVPLTLLDRSRDQLERVREAVPRLAPGLAVLERALGAAADAVERLPLLRRGERPDTAR